MSLYNAPAGKVRATGESCVECGRPAKYCRRVLRRRCESVSHEPLCGLHRWRPLSALVRVMLGRPPIAECPGHPRPEADHGQA